jgi:HEAT repeat protein
VCAIEALGRIGDGAGIEALVDAASSGSFFRVFPAVDVLSRTSDPGALEPLVRLLGDPLAGPEAARALGRRGETDAIPALASLLSARSDAMVRVAAVALLDIAERQRERFGGADSVASAVREATHETDVAGRVARSVQGGDAVERAAICRLLGWLGDQRATASLIDLLADEPPIAHAAARSLAELGGVAERELLLAIRDGDSARRALLLPSVPMRPEIADEVVPCLDDPDPDVRALACDALARAGSTAAIGRLFDTLEDDDPKVAQAAVTAIQALGHADTEPLALEAARSATPRVRRAALRMLGYFGWPSGLPLLVEALGAKDEKLRDAAIQSLPFIDDPQAIEALLTTSRSSAPRARAAAMRALGQTSAGAEVIARLEEGLGDSDAWARYFAVQSLGRLGAAGALDALVALLDDEAGHVRIAVIDALARVPGERAAEALLSAARSEDPDLRRAALLGLGIARPPEGLAVVIDAVQHAEPATRVFAIGALARFDEPEVDAALASAARDRDEAIRTAAIGALAARPGATPTATLASMLDDETLRGVVVPALATYAVGRIPGLLAALEVADGMRAPLLVSALARMGRAEAHGALAVAIAMDRPHARRAAAAALAAIDSPTSRALLERALAHDSDPEVRRVAAHALARR